jgi:hypothetical protein
LLTVPNMTFEPGHHYTIVIAGKTKDTPKLETIQNKHQAQSGNGDAGSFAVNDCDDEVIVDSDIRGRNEDDYAKL